MAQRHQFVGREVDSLARQDAKCIESEVLIVSIGGTINIGDSGKAGLLAITGTYTQFSTGTMKASIGGTSVGTQFSQLQITGAASLGGNLTTALVNGFTPTVGQTFAVLTAYSVTGTFSNTTIAINGSEHFNISYTATGVVLTVASGPSKAGRTAAAGQPAMASTKQNVAVAKAPVVISGLRHPTGVPAKWQRPILVAGVKREARYSSAIGERS